MTEHDRSALTTPSWYGDLIAGHAGGWILEIGCGGGALIEGIVGRTRVEGVGCDVAPTFSPECNPRLKYALCDGCELPFEADVFDTVVSIEVIEHLDRPVDLVREVWRVLKADGTFFLKTPNKWTHDGYQLLHRCLAASREWHPNVMTHKQLRDLLGERFDVVYYKADGLAPNQREKLRDRLGFGVLNAVPFDRLPLAFQPSIYAACTPRGTCDDSRQVGRRRVPVDRTA